MPENINPPWWKTLNRYQWFVFIVASVAWMLDCLDQQLFVLGRDNAIQTLLAAGDGVAFEKVDAVRVKQFGSYAMSIFIAGWALGGLIFGALGDRIGRAKTLAVTVLIYSLCTGLSAFATTFTQFAIFRALTGLGVGGVFGLSVALMLIAALFGAVGFVAPRVIDGELDAGGLLSRLRGQ